MADLILVADDELNIDKMFRRMFEDEIAIGKYEFIFSENGEQAQQEIIARSSQITLLLIDIKMPIVAGDELLEWLEKKQLTIPSIIITAFPDDTRSTDAVKYQPLGFVQKPLSSAKLKKLIEDALNKIKQDRQKQQKQIEELVKTLNPGEQYKLVLSLLESLPPKQLQAVNIFLENKTSMIAQTQSRYTLPQLKKFFWELPAKKQKKLISLLVNRMSYEDIEDIQDDLEAIKTEFLVEKENWEFILEEDRKRVDEGKIPLAILIKGWFEKVRMTSGNRFGPYFFWRWSENGRLRGKSIDKEELVELLQELMEKGRQFPKILGLRQRLMTEFLDSTEETELDNLTSAEKQKVLTIREEITSRYLAQEQKSQPVAEVNIAQASNPKSQLIAEPKNMETSEPSNKERNKPKVLKLNWERK